jgi:hypothetical protein
MGSPGEDWKNAYNKLVKLLAQHGLTWWSDLPVILAAADAKTETATTTSQAQTDGPEVNVLDLVLRLIQDYAVITPAERMATALWTLHTFVFNRFKVTPRLALLSPVRGCGKSTLLELVELLTDEPCRTNNTTAAAIYHLLDRRPNTTMLCDEGDNLNLAWSGVLRSVFNSNRRGDCIIRHIGGRSRNLPTFCPLAVAAIGMLPLPLLHRAVVINMQRAPAGAQIQCLDEHSPVFSAVHDQIRRWAATCALDPDPEIPLHNRAADNWRVLLAIADALGAGEEARAAALELDGSRQDEDVSVIALTDIQRLFTARGINFDRIASEALVEAMIEVNDFWLEWRGPNDDWPLPRKLTQAGLSRLLGPFRIKPKTIWPLHRRPSDKSRKGFYRVDFEPAWDAYCSPRDTPAQPSNTLAAGMSRHSKPSHCPSHSARIQYGEKPPQQQPRSSGLSSVCVSAPCSGLACSARDG